MHLNHPLSTLRYVSQRARKIGPRDLNQVEEWLALECFPCPNVQIQVALGCVPKILKNLEKNHQIIGMHAILNSTVKSFFRTTLNRSNFQPAAHKHI